MPAENVSLAECFNASKENGNDEDDDHEWRLTHVNKEFERLLLRERQDVLGNVLWDEFKDAAGTPFDMKFRRAVASKEAFAFEEFYAPVNCWFEVRAFPSDEGLAVYFRDITARRKVQALHRELEMQLRQAQQMESLGTLAGGIAHDFNNILAIILGNLEMVRTDVGPSHATQEGLLQRRRRRRQRRQGVH